VNDKILGLKKQTHMIWTGDTTEFVTKGKKYKILGRRKEETGDGKFRYSYNFTDDTGQEEWGMSFLFVALKRTK